MFEFHQGPLNDELIYHPDKDDELVLTVYNCSTCEISIWCNEFIRKNGRHYGHSFWCGKVLNDIFLFRGYNSGFNINEKEI